MHSTHSGSTGSRLISGNSDLAETLEAEIASFHKAEAALLYNSGYDANLGLLSCVAGKNDLILSDELIHASLYDGIRLSYAKHFKFRHNDLHHLGELIARHKDMYEHIYVVVESIYSMDGDAAPLKEMTTLCKAHAVFLIVDEAHAIGVCGKSGRGLCEGNEEDFFARIYTYGKAMGCHGAAVVGSRALRDYLVNFSRPFIYTTALPFHSLARIKAAYQLLKEETRMQNLKGIISAFNTIEKTNFIKSESAIHCRIVPGNEEAERMQDLLADHGFHVKAIKSPTVKAGSERLRISLHAFNTKEEIAALAALVK